MRKRFASLIGTLASLILIFCILFTALQVTMNSDFIIRQEYKKLGIAHEVGMSYEDVVASCEQLIYYMEGTVDSIDIEVTVNGQRTLMYTDPQEISHMVDVQLLYQTFRSYRDYGVLAALVLYLIAALISIRTAPHSIAVGYCTGGFITLLAAGFAGTWAFLDFTSFWTFFHESLFWNDDWLFPPSSRMIQILPEMFFSDIILYFALISAVALLLLFFIALIMLSSEKKQKKAAQEEYILKKKNLHKVEPSVILPDDTEDEDDEGEESFETEDEQEAEETMKTEDFLSEETDSDSVLETSVEETEQETVSDPEDTEAEEVSPAEEESTVLPMEEIEKVTTDGTPEDTVTEKE